MRRSTAPVLWIRGALLRVLGARAGGGDDQVIAGPAILAIELA